MEEDDGMHMLPCPLPERIFAAGDEPIDVRVTPYHKRNRIKQIMNSLHPDEVEQIRVSLFGKLIEIADKPSFSKTFGRYIISKCLSN
ncbi:unnamed protein product, partial [Eruca vesicaria subsp. sativa]|nr:unnamed protein product [Eruca vesicaria subsp. sativa]